MRTVAEKMGLRAGSRAYFIGAPSDVHAAMKLPKLETPTSLDGMFDHIHLFVLTASDLNEQFPTLRNHVAPKGRLWVSWPKGKQNRPDLNIREVIRIGYQNGMVESTALSVNEVWSALKFTMPIPGRRYNNSYGTLPDPS